MPTKTVISQLKPFSARRFDACMNYLMHEYGATLDQYDIAKLHVFIDFFHVLETGKQVIGGPLQPWPNGPVIKPGYDRVRSLGHRLDEDGKPTHLGHLRVIGKHKKAYRYAPQGEVDTEDFSPSEFKAMEKAWQFRAKLIAMPWQKREDFFHLPKSYMGKVWSVAKKQKRDIDWSELIEAYDQEHGTDHTGSRLMVDAWRED